MSLGGKELHINILDLQALLLSIHAFAHELEDGLTRVFCDITTAINYVNEKGLHDTTALHYVMEMTGSKPKFCIVATFKHGVWNTSRELRIHTYKGRSTLQVILPLALLMPDMREKSTGTFFLNILRNAFGTSSITLFISRLNKQVTMFCSWKPVPGTSYRTLRFFPWTGLL